MNIMLSKTFFPQHYRAGQPTGFAELVRKGVKRHTCRANYDYWKDRIATLQKRNGTLSLRQWSGKPYEKGSHTERILDVPASMVEVQRLVLMRTPSEDIEPTYEEHDGTFVRVQGYEYTAEVEGHPCDVGTIAKNDGLSLEDFKAWFNPVFDEYEAKGGEASEPKRTALTFAIIHFTTFRY